MQLEKKSSKLLQLDSDLSPRHWPVSHSLGILYQQVLYRQKCNQFLYRNWFDAHWSACTNWCKRHAGKGENNGMSLQKAHLVLGEDHLLWHTYK